MTRSRIAVMFAAFALFMASALPAPAQPIGSFADGAPLAPAVHGQSGPLNGVYFGSNFIGLGTHVVGFGTAPALTTCGTSPVANTGNTDTAGTITTGSAATTCTITFNVPFNNAPACTLQAQGNATQPTYTVSGTAITVSVDVASTVYSYMCIGKQGG